MQPAVNGRAEYLGDEEDRWDDIREDVRRYLEERTFSKDRVPA